MRSVRIVALAACLTMVIGCLDAQEVATTNLMELSTPSNPALTLMGVQPTEVTRPKSWNQLESSLINEFSGEGGGLAIPNDFGLEFMPYWLRSNPLEKFRESDLTTNRSRPLQSLSVSLGSVNTERGDTVDSRIGFGLRTQILSGKVAADDINAIKRYSQMIVTRNMQGADLFSILAQVEDTKAQSYKELDTQVRDSIASLLPADQVKDALANWTSFYDLIIKGHKLSDPLTSAEAQALVIAMEDSVAQSFNNTEVNAMADSIKNLKTARYGLIWEVAASTFLQFPTGDFEYSEIPKFGTWTTLTYRTKNQKFDFIGTVRYIEDFQLEKRTFNLDFGASLVCHVGNLSFSGEYLQRYQQRQVERTVTEDGFDLKTNLSGYDYRATLNATYRVTKNVVVNYSFGKRFDFSDQAQNNLVSQLSVNFGFGSVPLSF